MYLVGLTGGIGAGKSSVLEMLKEKGAVTIEADKVAREVVEPGEPALENLKAAFGKEVINEDGTLNRQELSARAFTSEEKVKLLNGITHPAIQAKILDTLAENEGKVVVLENPLLIEQQKNELANNYDYDLIVSVEADKEDRTHRLITERKMNPQDVHNRMSMQLNDEQRRENSDIVIVNDGTKAELQLVVDQVWGIVQENKKEEDK